MTTGHDIPTDWRSPGRAGLLTRILRRPCSVCERHEWYRDPYVRASNVCYMHCGRWGQWVYR